MEFSRQGYWSGLPFPSPGDLLNPGVKPRSPTLQTDALPSELPAKPIKIFDASKVQTSSYKRNKSWGGNVQSSDYSHHYSNVYLKVAKRLDLNVM